MLLTGYIVVPVVTYKIGITTLICSPIIRHLLDILIVSTDKEWRSVIGPSKFKCWNVLETFSSHVTRMTSFDSGNKIFNPLRILTDLLPS